MVTLVYTVTTDFNIFLTALFFQSVCASAGLTIRRSVIGDLFDAEDSAQFFRPFFLSLVYFKLWARYVRVRFYRHCTTLFLIMRKIVNLQTFIRSRAKNGGVGLQKITAHLKGCDSFTLRSRRANPEFHTMKRSKNLCVSAGSTACPANSMTSGLNCFSRPANRKASGLN